MDHAADAQRTDLMTITRFVLNEQSKYPESRGDFTILLSHIVLGCKFVCSAVNKVFFFLLPCSILSCCLGIVLVYYSLCLIIFLMKGFLFFSGVWRDMIRILAFQFDDQNSYSWLWGIELCWSWQIWFVIKEGQKCGEVFSLSILRENFRIFGLK